MTDIVERLRKRIQDPETWNTLVDDAADEIERLRAALDDIRTSDSLRTYEFRRIANAALKYNPTTDYLNASKGGE